MNDTNFSSAKCRSENPHKDSTESLTKYVEDPGPSDSVRYGPGQR